MFLANVVNSGEKIGIGEAAITALLGYVVVFVGLALLMFVVIIMGKIMVASKAKKTAAAPSRERERSKRSSKWAKAKPGKRR